jgi:hypothetical protein
VAGSGTSASRSPASIAQLSQTALLSAAACVPANDSEATAGLLYHSNWLPLSPEWLQRFPDEAAITQFVAGGAEVARTLASDWIRSQDQHWISWRGRRHRAAPQPISSFKIYVSVMPDYLPEAFGRAVEVYTSAATASFKLSRRPRALLRPDRLVAYCQTRAAVEELVDKLAGVAKLPVHGVPFTASQAEGAAVSWAQDPPSAVAGYAGSWRRWITRKLAGYLHASDSSSAAGRAAFALGQLGADGVDTTAWIRPSEAWEVR